MQVIAAVRFIISDVMTLYSVFLFMPLITPLSIISCLSLQSNPQQLFYERLQNLLLPSHTYGVVSGGDPAHIPDLTWKKLKDFHTHHYHPSNARFFSCQPYV